LNTERVVEEARAYAEEIIETVREPLLVLNEDLRVISANKSFYDTFQVSPEESEKELIYDLGNQQWDIPKLRVLLEDILPKNTKFEAYEVEHDFETIGKRIMVLNARKIYRETNNSQMILLAIEDITDRRKAEKEKEQLQSILSSQKDPVFVIFGDYTIAFMNQSAYEIFGAEIAGKKCHNIIKGSDYPCDHCPIKAITESNILEVRFEQCVILPYSEETKFFDVKATHIENYDGKPAIVELSRDITHLRMAENDLKKSESMLRESLTKTNFYKDLLTHDMNNILQGILSGAQFSELIHNDPNQLEELRSSIRIIREQVIRGTNLIRNIRKISQLEEHEIQFKKVEICNILKNSISNVKNTYQDKNINIQVDSIDKKLYVQIGEFLEDVFENILINAIRHNKNPLVKITIRISKYKKNSTNYFKIEFLDNGEGIDDNRKKIIFHRGNAKKGSVPGMGLGLSLVNVIVESYNGEIWVEDRIKGDYTKGSNFVLLIPEVI